jgi:hypothetical protein
MEDFMNETLADKIFSRLAPFVCKKTQYEIITAHLLGEHVPDRIITGNLGPIRFVVSADNDGQIEASVSVKSGNVEECHIQALCNAMQVDATGEAERTPTGMVIWIVQEGATQ